MRNLLKIAAVLVLSFAAYYLVMGGSMLMSQGQLSQAMVDFSKEEESKLLEAGEEIEDGAEALDVASASHAVLVMALTMLADQIDLDVALQTAKRLGYHWNPEDEAVYQ